MSKNKKYLSASRIKTFESCSWLYWCNYHLKIPQRGNPGMWMGSVCHLIFELLLTPKHKKHYSLIIAAETIEASKPIEKLVVKHLKKYGIFENDYYELIDKMVLVGLKQDFFVKGGKLLEPEFKFDITNENPEYRIYGFIDKAAQFKKNKTLEIYDYKSSKAKFKGEGLDANIQAMMYSLVSKKKWPDFKPIIKFMFLRFPKKPIQELAFNDDTLKGFEHYLAEVYKKVTNFKEENAKTNYAADQKRPSDGGWGGSLNCGFASFKGQLKKDGTPMWHCPYKFDFSYYALKNEDGDVIKTSLENDFTAGKKEKIVKMRYNGCPRFNLT